MSFYEQREPIMSGDGFDSAACEKRGRLFPSRFTEQRTKLLLDLGLLRAILGCVPGELDGRNGLRKRQIRCQCNSTQARQLVHPLQQMHGYRLGPTETSSTYNVDSSGSRFVAKLPTYHSLYG